MEETREKFNKLFIKVKNSRSLQVKIALVVGALLLYHFLFGDIGNRNVEIESIILESPFIGVYPPRDAIFSVSLENDKLKINKFSKFEIDEKYCRSIEGSYKLNSVISFYPIIVECEPAISVVDDVIITNGKWMQFAKHRNSISGQNEKYLLLEDYSLINKLTGEITQNKITNSANGYRLQINGAATVSENKQYFISYRSSVPQNPSLVKINKTGEIIPIYKFNNYDFFKSAHIKKMVSSKEGDYVFMLVEKTRRMPGDLLLYIVDVKNKSLIYRETLDEYQHGYQNIYIRNQSDTILFIFKASSIVYAYKVKLKK